MMAVMDEQGKSIKVSVLPTHTHAHTHKKTHQTDSGPFWVYVMFLFLIVIQNNNRRARWMANLPGGGEGDVE